MPAVRTARPDIILRVPRAIHVSSGPARTEDEQQQQQGGHAHAAEPVHGTAYRRSVSPVKGGALPDARTRASTDAGRIAPTASSSSSSEDKSEYRYAAQATSTAEWNSLLIWARGQRGPQWDSSTGMWQVDQGSNEYYAFANDPARHTKLSSSRRTEGGSAQQGGHAQGEDGSAPVAHPQDGGDRKPSAFAQSDFPAHGLASGSRAIHPSSSINGDSFHPGGEGSRGVRGSSQGPAAGGHGSIDDSPPIGSGARRHRAR